MEISKSKKRITKLAIIIFILNMLGGINILRAEAYSNIVFKNITIEDGLAQATVESIFQDSRGYIWFGTNDGLTRYNGYDFEIYRNEIGVDNSICSNYIICINEDLEGNLWVGTINGVSKINLQTNSISNYRGSDKLSDNNITEILITSNGDILLSTIDGLNMYNKSKDKFERIFDDDALINQEIYSLDEDVNGDIWIGSSGGLTKVNLKTKTSLIYSNTVLNDIVYKVLCDDEYVWLGTQNSGLYRINYNTMESEIINKNNSNLVSNNINTLLKDKNGYMWIGTNEGLVKYKIGSNNFTRYFNKNYDRYSLVDDYVYSVIQDNSGLIWVGTYSGVSMFEPENKIEHHKVDPLSDSSISENMIHGLYEDDNGFLWIGTNTKGINILDRKNEKIFKFTTDTENISLSSNIINDITGNKNKIFIGTNNGLNIYDKSNKTIKVYNEENGLNNNKVRNITYDSKGFLWIGTSDGFNILNLENDKMINLNPLLNKYNVNDKHSGNIFEDSEGIYWLGTFLSGGLLKIDPINNSITNYKHDDNSNSISNDSVRTITEDEEGNLWIGTSGGLNKFNKKTEEFTYYTTLDGLPNNNIYGILFDDENNLWMSTNLGLARYDVEKNTFLNLNVTDGLQSNEFNGNAYLKLKSGDLVFGGINGLNIFNPDDILNTLYVPKVQFDSFRLNGVKIDTLENTELKYNENTINITFFLPDYKNIKNIQYYYSIEGTGSEWFPTNTNEIVLSNLSPGTYEFKVKARNSSGDFSEERSFEFTIKPPIWKSGKFIAIYILIIIVSIAVIIEMKNRKMRLLDEMVAVRTRELSDEMEKNTELLNKVISLEKRKNAYLVNISHELRTPLNVLSSIHQLIMELNKSEEGISADRIDHYMNILGKNVVRLLKLINDLIDTSKIEHGNYTINISKNNIVYIVEETSLSLKDYVESKDIELIIDPDIEECIIECDEAEIERCIINLVNNAAKFTDEGGKILVSVVELENDVKITVSDNGIGMEEKYLENIFDRFNQIIDSNREVKGGSGLGLTITKLIVGLHNGEIYAESRVNEGSRFTIILPKVQPKEDESLEKKEV